MRTIARPTLLRLLAASVMLAATGPASAEMPAGWDKPMRGITLDLPAEWTSAYEAGEPQSIEATCETPACESTLEVCTIVVPDEPIDVPRAVPGAWMVKLLLGTDDIRDSALEAAKEGSTITREPSTLWIGKRSWYVTETIAPYGWKSLFHATTIVDGRFIRVRCRTCDRTDARFAFARDILARIKLGS